MTPSRLASGSRPTGGVSRMTQSNASRASVDQPAHALRGEAGDRIRLGRPAGRIAEARRHLMDRQALRRRRAPARRSGPRRCRMPNTVCSVGRRRSASMSSTLRWYDSLSVSARFVAVSVLPSPGSALAIITTSGRARLRVVKRRGQPAVLLARLRLTPLRRAQSCLRSARGIRSKEMGSSFSASRFRRSGVLDVIAAAGRAAGAGWTEAEAGAGPSPLRHVACAAQPSQSETSSETSAASSGVNGESIVAAEAGSPLCSAARCIAS